MFEAIRDALARQLRVDPEKITLSSRIKDDLGADSLDILQLLMTVEEEFGIEQFAVVSRLDAPGVVCIVSKPERIRRALEISSSSRPTTPTAALRARPPTAR